MGTALRNAYTHWWQKEGKLMIDLELARLAVFRLDVSKPEDDTKNTDRNVLRRT